MADPTYRPGIEWPRVAVLFALALLTLGFGAGAQGTGDPTGATGRRPAPRRVPPSTKASESG